GLVRGFDAREHRAVTAVADVEGELQEPVGAVDLLGIDDARDAEIDLRKVVDADGRRGGWRHLCLAASRRGLQSGLLNIEQRVDLLRIDTGHEMRKGADNILDLGAVSRQVVPGEGSLQLE